MRSFNSEEFSSHFTQLPRQGTYLRPAVITSVNPAKGTVNIEWLDHPGTRQDVLISPSGQGIFELPTTGSTVLVGFGSGYDAYILAYIPVGYRDLVGTPRDDGKEVAPSILKISAGEKMLISYLSKSDENKNSQFDSPSPTGTYFYMSNVGDILMKTAEGDYWKLDRRSNIIQQNSMNYRAITEAGILDFGLIKRAATNSEKQTEDIISSTGAVLGDSSGDNALTEFRLRILETADANATTAPEVDDPLIELTLGTKVSNDGQIIKTDNTYAANSKEIIIQLKTKAAQGFEFTVDKEGNLTVKVTGNVKFAISNGDAQIDVDEGREIRLGGADTEKILLGETFQKSFNKLVNVVQSLQYITPSGSPAPVINASFAKSSSDSDLSKKVRTQ
jgi:hypothetical protein